MKYFAPFLLPIVYLSLSLSLFVSCTETQPDLVDPSDDADNQTDAFTETPETISISETVVTFSPSLSGLRHTYLWG